MKVEALLTQENAILKIVNCNILKLMHVQLGLNGKELLVIVSITSALFEEHANLERMHQGW